MKNSRGWPGETGEENAAKALFAVLVGIPYKTHPQGGRHSIRWEHICPCKLSRRDYSAHRGASPCGFAALMQYYRTGVYIHSFK
jgi:hypothetical protein